MKTALSRVIMMAFVILSLFAQVGGATTAKAAPHPAPLAMVAVSEQVAASIDMQPTVAVPEQVSASIDTIVPLAVSDQVAPNVMMPMAFSATHCGVSSQFWVYDRHIVRSADGYEAMVWKRKVSTGTSVCMTMYKLTIFHNTPMYIKVNAVTYSGIGGSKSVSTLLKPGTSAALGFKHYLSPWYNIRVYALAA